MIFLILSFRNLFVATNETVHYTLHLIRPKMLESVCAKFFLSPHPFCYSHSNPITLVLVAKIPIRYQKCYAVYAILFLDYHNWTPLKRMDCATFWPPHCEYECMLNDWLMFDLMLSVYSIHADQRQSTV